MPIRSPEIDGALGRPGCDHRVVRGSGYGLRFSLERVAIDQTSVPVPSQQRRRTEVNLRHVAVPSGGRTFARSGVDVCAIPRERDPIGSVPEFNRAVLRDVKQLGRYPSAGRVAEVLAVSGEIDVAIIGPARRKHGRSACRPRLQSLSDGCNQPPVRGDLGRVDPIVVVERRDKAGANEIVERLLGDPIRGHFPGVDRLLERLVGPSLSERQGGTGRRQLRLRPLALRVRDVALRFGDTPLLLGAGRFLFGERPLVLGDLPLLFGAVLLVFSAGLRRLGGVALISRLLSLRKEGDRQCEHRDRRDAHCRELPSDALKLKVEELVLRLSEDGAGERRSPRARLCPLRLREIDVANVKVERFVRKGGVKRRRNGS